MLFRPGLVYILGGKTAIQAIPFPAMMYILAGGVAYTVGAVFYGVAAKKKLRYIHSVFHIFVVIGSILQYLGIILYIL